MTSIRLQDIERHSWRMTNKDGLLDILFGFMLLGACLSALVGLRYALEWLRILVLCGIQFGGVAFVIWMRKRMVAPRIGRVKFSSKRTRRVRTLRIVMAVCVAVTVLLVVATSLSQRFDFALFRYGGAWSVVAVVAAVVMIPLSAMAIVLDYPRLLLYGSLFVIAEFLLEVVGLDDFTSYAETIVYGAGSVIAFAIGIPIFLKFLRSVPRIVLEEFGGSSESSTIAS